MNLDKPCVLLTEPETFCIQSTTLIALQSLTLLQARPAFNLQESSLPIFDDLAGNFRAFVRTKLQPETHKFAAVEHPPGRQFLGGFKL